VWGFGDGVVEGGIWRASAWSNLSCDFIFSQEFMNIEPSCVESFRLGIVNSLGSVYRVFSSLLMPLKQQSRLTVRAQS